MDTVTIKGKDYPFVSGRGALRLYARKKGLSDIGNKEFVEVLGELSMDDADLLNWCCFKAGCGARGIEFPYDYDEFQEVLTELPHLVDEIDALADQQTPPAGKGKPGKGKSKG